MNRSLIASGIFFFFSSLPKFPDIGGRWRVHDPRGAGFQINFKADHTFTAYTTEGKVLVTGNYRTEKDSFLVNDANCNIAYWGSYKLTFYTDDSIHFQTLSDTCSGRAAAIDGLTMGRIKK